MKRIKERKSKEKKVLSVFSYMLFAVSKVLVVLSILAIMATLINIYNQHLSVDFSKQGIDNFLSFFSCFYSLFYGTIFTITLTVALSTFQNSKTVESVNSLARIREMLSTEENMKIHEILEGNEWDDKNKFTEFYDNIENKCQLFNYLGTLELVSIYLDNGIMSHSDFKCMFGYRLRNIERCKPLMEKLQSKKEHWTILLHLIEETNGKI